MTINYITYNGKKMSLRSWARMWGTNYDTALRRWKRGERDIWKLINMDGPRKFTISKEDREWLKATAFARKGQESFSQKYKIRDAEWDIACDLIGIPRAFANELKEAMQ